MKKTDLEQVKKLAEQLTPQDRIELFYHIAYLPDSGIQPADVVSPSEEIQSRYTEALKESEDMEYFGLLYDENNVIVILKGRVIFELLFYPENFNDAWLKVHSWQYAPLPESVVNQVRESYIARGIEISDEELIEAGKHAIMETYKAETYRISHELSVRLPEMMKLLVDAAIKIIQIDIRNSLNQEKKTTLSEIEKVLEPYWRTIKEEQLGVTRGGARRRNSKFVWDAEKALRFYKTVEAMPRHGADNRLMWEYAREMLRDSDYDNEAVQFLRSRPAFRDVPEDLLKEAASVWRQYDESWDTLPPANSPQAFAFRYACHKLDFPYSTYNTARTNYYKGKKASESKG